MQTNGEGFLPVRIGLHIRLSELGFGYLSLPGPIFVRLTETLKKTDPQTQRIQFEVISWKTKLRPKVTAKRPEDIWKWWKDELGPEQVRAIVERHSRASYVSGKSCTFVTNGDGQLMQGSWEPVVRL